MKSLPLILSLLFFQSIYSFEEDKVESIPDYSYNGTLFSGYLNVSEVKKFHYMFNKKIMKTNLLFYGLMEVQAVLQ